MWTHVVCIHKSSLSVLTTLSSLAGQAHMWGEWESGQRDYMFGTAVTALLCGCSVVKLLFSPDHILAWLIWLSSPRHNGTNNCQTPPYYGYVSSLRIPVFKWRIIMKLNRKLLEKQRVQNRFAAYEVYIGHFFYNINATVSWKLFSLVYIQIFKFFTGLRDRQTDKTNCLTPSRMHAWGN